MALAWDFRLGENRGSPPGFPWDWYCLRKARCSSPNQLSRGVIREAKVAYAQSRPCYRGREVGLRLARLDFCVPPAPEPRRRGLRPRFSLFCVAVASRYARLVARDWQPGLQ